MLFSVGIWLINVCHILYC